MRWAGPAIPTRPTTGCGWSDRAWAETVATGVTIVRDTVFPVGNAADPWGDYQKDIASGTNLFAPTPTG